VISRDFKQGNQQQQYYKSLAVMDTAVENIYDALDKQDQLDNTYIIFASDNGGCPTGGGRNVPLRGTKGSLFEGGSKVESFIYSTSLSSKLSGSSYDNVFHVTDWFPTLVDLAGGSYDAPSGYDLDGVSHYDSIFNGDDAPRDYMLYNYYYDPASPDEDLWAGKAMAIRDSRYKLVHTYDSSSAGTWYTTDMTLDSDDNFEMYDGCAQFAALLDGEFTVRYITPYQVSRP
jgi:arylsulfatase A-like enzyme